jgi:mRNA interferase YafQ
MFKVKQTKYFIDVTNRFKKSYKLAKKINLDINLLDALIDTLAETGTLPPEYKAHKLQGKYNDIWECHIKADWLLLWKQDDKILTLLLIDIGSHSDMF